MVFGVRGTSRGGGLSGVGPVGAEADMADTERLRSYSEKKNAGKGANKLYTSNNGQIDEGFFMAKIIKHAFSTLPKSQYMQFLSNTVLQTEKEELEDLADLTTLDDIPEKTVEEGEATDVSDENSEESY